MNHNWISVLSVICVIGVAAGADRSSCIAEDERSITLPEFRELADRACSYVHTNESMSPDGLEVVDGKPLRPPVQAGDFSSISDLTKIRGIALRRDAKDEDLAALAKLPELRCINAAYCYFITDIGITALERHPTLRIIKLYRNEPLEHPYTLPDGFVLFQKPNLSENAIKSLASIPNLTTLWIFENRFTIKGVRYLYECDELKSLRLRGNKLSQRDVKEIRAMLGGCEVDGDPEFQ